MAATPWDPIGATARDRVRELTGDQAATRQDEAIARALTKFGFVGDPDGETTEQEVPELDASIYLLQTSPVSSGGETTIKQGTVSRTTKEGSTGGYEAILKNLLARRNALVLANLDAGSGIAVVPCRFPDLEPCNGYPSYGY